MVSFPNKFVVCTHTFSTHIGIQTNQPFLRSSRRSLSTSMRSRGSMEAGGGTLKYSSSAASASAFGLRRPSQQQLYQNRSLLRGSTSQLSRASERQRSMENFKKLIDEDINELMGFLKEKTSLDMKEQYKAHSSHLVRNNKPRMQQQTKQQPQLSLDLTKKQEKEPEKKTATLKQDDSEVLKTDDHDDNAQSLVVGETKSPGVVRAKKVEEEEKTKAMEKQSNRKFFTDLVEEEEWDYFE
mmetsp:Transcript_36547/g.56145  ORF Transcript_36547/g.56145 Transcript_36547/m.56145 type:complete len:240 (-) Transcript_36547:621-1340(-)